MISISENLTRGSSYLLLPNWVSRKGGVVNPKNENDEECFKWAFIAALHYADIRSHPERISNLARFEDYYDWSGLEFPLSIKGISEFEKRNDVSINMLVVDLISNVLGIEEIRFTLVEEVSMNQERKSLTYC